MSKARVHWVDIAKGITIICVLFGHTVGTPALLARFVYLFHMPAFFMLSGYVFSNKRKFGNFLTVKLRTVILPIFTIGLTGAVLVGLAMKLLKHEDINWKWTFLNPFVQYGDHNLLWYLASLFVLLIIFYGLTKLLKDKIKLIIPISFLLGLGSYCFIKFVGITVPWNIDIALVALPFTAIGYGLKKSESCEKLKNPFVLLAAAAVCIAVGYINVKYFCPDLFKSVDMHQKIYGNIFLFYIAAIAGSFMIISLSMLINNNILLEYFGKNSIIIYAFEPAQYFVNFLLKTVGITRYSGRPFIILLAVSILSVAVIMLVNCILSAEINQFAPFLIGRSRDNK
ncbi:MAG: acyltransferase family protein [Clostridiales bacterium]|nr:acyltransferase family protein [Clostridiales bacterium]